MSCCDTGLAVAAIAAESGVIGEEVRLASRDVGGGLRQTDLSVPAFTAASASGRSNVNC